MSCGGWWRRTDEIYEAVRIGEGLAVSGRLGEAPMRRALATLDVFDHFCRAAMLGAADVDAVATSAIRDADNGEGFVRLAREHTSLPIRVLSREAGGPLRVPRGGQLDDARRRLRARSRRRVAAAGGGRGPARARARLMAAGRGAHDRALPAGERRAQAEADRRAARVRRRRAAGRRLARRRGPHRSRQAAGRDGRHRAQPGRGRPARAGAAVQRSPGRPSSQPRSSRSSSSAWRRCPRRSAARSRESSPRVPT